MKTISTGDLLAVTRLIENGANINLKTQTDYSVPIVFSIYLQNLEMVKLLMQHNADTNIKIENTYTLSEFANYLGKKTISTLLSEATGI